MAEQPEIGILSKEEEFGQTVVTKLMELSPEERKYAMENISDIFTHKLFNLEEEAGARISPVVVDPPIAPPPPGLSKSARRKRNKKSKSKLWAK